MLIDGCSALVTGGASGLGNATARALTDAGARVVLLDLPSSQGEKAATALGPTARFVPGDVTDGDQVQVAVDAASELASLRIVVNCAGIATAARMLGRDGVLPLEDFERVVRVNLIGTFNTLRLAAASMARNEPVQGERGACVLTASVAGYEGQIGQIPYASAKAGIIGMTIVAARDLATRMIRVCTIAPGLFDTPILAKLPDNIRQSLAASVPNPARLGHPSEYALTALHILENPMLNGETIRLDGAIRMSPR